MPTRRQFLRAAAVGSVAVPYLWIPAAAQSRTVRHASFGAGGQALSDITAFSKHPAFDLVAVADVDLCRLDRILDRFPKARVYQDWRELLDKEAGGLDSVNVSTPDHMHALQALAAMRLGKHVYVQKPLAATLRETRVLAEYARKARVISQMGIQVSSAEGQRYGEWLVRSGIVGKVREVHTFSNKSWGDDKPLPDAEDQVPPTLDWDQWLGVAERRAFKRNVYHPGHWRRRIGFGTGTLGDMGCHIYSPPYRALALTSPVNVTAHGPSPSPDSWAVKARVHLVYPGTEYTAGSTVDMWWYDGGELPPDQLREQVGARMPEQGSLVVGTDGLLVLPHGGEPFALPESKMAAVQKPSLPPRDHYGEFLDAVLAGPGTSCSAGFDYSGPLTESVLIGNVAAYYPGQALEFDGARLAFTNNAAANAHLSREYRKGWRPKGVSLEPVNL
jgi:predicted dehydrogenase